MLRLLSHKLHVVRTRAHVFSRDVSAAERFDKPAVRMKDRFAIDWTRLLQDNGFPATKRHARQRVLVSHATRESQHVVDRFLLVSILPKPRAADCWAKARVMNRYQSVVTLVPARNQTLVLV